MACSVTRTGVERSEGKRVTEASYIAHMQWFCILSSALSWEGLTCWEIYHHVLANTTPFLTTPLIIRAKLRKLIESLELALLDQSERSVPGLGAIMKDNQEIYIIERILEKEIRSEPNQARRRTAESLLSEVIRL